MKQIRIRKIAALLTIIFTAGTVLCVCGCDGKNKTSQQESVVTTKTSQTDREEEHGVYTVNEQGYKFERKLSNYSLVAIPQVSTCGMQGYKNEKLIDLTKITVPTLMICGGSDPNLNYDMVNSSLDLLPKVSQLEVIEGGAHVIMYEKPYYREFQNKLIAFLK